MPCRSAITRKASTSASPRKRWTATIARVRLDTRLDARRIEAEGVWIEGTNGVLAPPPASVPGGAP
jgi:hypothetical protein